MVNVVAVTGTAGGVGVTTVAAQFAAWLAAHNRRAIAFDFSPGNALRLHFGMAWGDGTGIVPQVLAGKPWHEAAYLSASGISFVPFGQTKGGDGIAGFCARLAGQQAWFSSRLKELDEPAEAFVICDCPHSEGALRSQALAAADLVLIVLAPDALSYAAAGDAAQGAFSGGARNVAFVINGFDPTRTLDRDVAVLARTNLQKSLAPVVVHRDESLREALASKQSVFDYAPASQASHDFAALAMWMIARLARPGQRAA